MAMAYMAKTSLILLCCFTVFFATHKVLVWPWQRSAAASEHAQPMGGSSIKKRPLDSRTQLLTTIVKSLDEVTVPVWRALQESCMSRPTVVSILYASGSPSIVREHMLEEYCSDLIMYHQWEVEGSEEFKKNAAHLKESRIDRLAFLRSWQKNKLAGQEEMVKSLDAVVVIDLDLLSLPTDEALSHAITTVNNPGEESVICANGYEKWLFARHYYDTFALVFEDGTWGWPMLTSMKSIIFFLQHDFHKKIR
jgi:hypothetical protein